MSEVRNLNYTSDKSCKCGTWIAHWEKFSKKKANECSVKNCKNKDLVGAHVKKVKEDKHYIIPLCGNHNKASSDVILDINPVIYVFSMIPANVAETCGK